MAVAAMSIVNAVAGGVSALGGSSSNEASNASQGYTSNAIMNILGPGGDPGSFVFNRRQFKKNEKYKKEQDKITNAYVEAQTEQIKSATQIQEEQRARQKKIRNLMLGYR